MKKKFFGDEWMPDKKGWGLIDSMTKITVDPYQLVTEEKIELTSWELHDMAVQVVRDYLIKQCYQIMSWQGNPDVDPAIWFVGDSTGPEWVVVRATRFPENQASRPSNWHSIANQCGRMSRIGHFASVAMVSKDQRFESGSAHPIPLWRGHAMHVRFTGLE